MAGSGPVLIAFSSHYLFRRLTMVQRKDIAGSWAYFLSLFDVFIYNINSTILMPNLVSAVKSLLIELSSGSKYECNGPCWDRTRVARSRVQRLNHWAIKVPERPSRLRLAGSLHYSPLFEIRAPWLGPFQPRRGASTHRRTRVTADTSVTDRAGIEPGSLAPESNA